MATVTTAEVRVFCDMASNYPAEGTLTQWINDNLAIVDQSFSSTADAIKNIVIKNRISTLYKATRTEGVTAGIQQATLAMFPALSVEERALLTGDATNVDAVKMNGKRSSETYGGRR